jgi:phosphoglycolate phosphatase
MDLTPARIRGLVFDKDGTLFDFEATWGGWAARLLTEICGPRAAEVGAALGFDLARRRFAPTSPIIAETSDTVAALLLPHLPGWERGALVRKMKSEAAETPLVEVAPLRPLLAALAARGLKLGLATNDDESSAHAHLACAGVDDLFGFVAGWDSGWGGKPEAGQLNAFLRWSGLAPAEVAMVGDSRHDLQAGRAAGMVTLGVLTGPATAAELADVADAVLPDIAALPGWLDGPRTA